MIIPFDADSLAEFALSNISCEATFKMENHWLNKKEVETVHFVLFFLCLYCEK